MKEGGTGPSTLGEKIGDRGSFVGIDAEVHEDGQVLGTDDGACESTSRDAVPLKFGGKTGERGSFVGLDAEGDEDGHELGTNDGASDVVQVGDE